MTVVPRVPEHSDPLRQPDQWGLKVLCLDVPPTLLVRADEVIE